MPLKRGRSKKTISRNIRELMHGPRFKKNKKKFGAKKAQKIAIAAAFAVSRRGKKRKKRRKS